VTDRHVAVYRHTLVAASEPYIVDQASSVPRYTTHWLGHRRGTASAPVDRTTISEWGTYRLRRLAFLAGRDPVINRALAHIEPSLIHAHFGPDGMYAAETARRFGLPLVVTFHGYDAARPDSPTPTAGARLWQRRRAALFEQASMLIAASDYVAQCLHALGAPDAKIVRHYIGVDTDRFTPIDRSGRGASNVLFVGRLTVAKGIIDLMNAMSIVRRAIPTASLTVIGDGELRDEVDRLNRDLNVGADVQGARAHDDVQAALSTADLLCVPCKASSSGQREGLGLVFAEAQACGLPVVSCRSGGIGEVVDDGVTGTLVNEGHVDAIATAIIELLRDPDRRRQMGTAGRARMVDEFDLRRQSALLADLYDTVLS
jgi:colanic acid/amylovoran biosynthesis glycosyltransferase